MKIRFAQNYEDHSSTNPWLYKRHRRYVINEQVWNLYAEHPGDVRDILVTKGDPETADVVYIWNPRTKQWSSSGRGWWSKRVYVPVEPEYIPAQIRQDAENTTDMGGWRGGDPALEES